MSKSWYEEILLLVCVDHVAMILLLVWGHVAMVLLLVSAGQGYRIWHCSWSWGDWTRYRVILLQAQVYSSQKWKNYLIKWEVIWSQNPHWVEYHEGSLSKADQALPSKERVVVRFQVSATLWTYDLQVKRYLFNKIF